MVTTIKTEELAAAYKDRIKRLIVRVSFESRSILIPALLRHDREISISAFVSKRKSDSAHKNRDILHGYWPNAKIISLDTLDAISSTMDIAKLIKEHADKDSLMETFIDISSFRREELLALLAILRSLGISRDTNCQLVYVGAEHMAEDWLSRNVIGHRSVVGFPGVISPSRKTKLVVMVGFGEIDRARSIIENYEPSKVLLGMGRQEDSTNNKFYLRNKEFFTDLVRQFGEEGQNFEFSVSDPLQTAMDLGKAIDLNDGTNIIIAPLHSKLSTIGAGLFALRNPIVQICYAPVEEYNEETYSSPGNQIHIIPLTDLDAF